MINAKVGLHKSPSSHGGHKQAQGCASCRAGGASLDDWAHNKHSQHRHRKNTKLGPWQAWCCVQESRGVSISRASFFPHRLGNRIRTLFPTT
jgi:hypothetical protein